MSLLNNDCTLITGQPNEGKSTRARAVAVAALHNPKTRVLHISYEETAKALLFKYAYSTEGVSEEKLSRITLRQGETHEGFDSFERSAQKFMAENEGSEVVVVVDPIDFLKTPGEETPIYQKLGEWARRNTVTVVATQHSAA